MSAIQRTGVDYYCQISDVELLQKLIKELPVENPVCINIGAAMGTSALAMLEARPDSRVFSIDIEPCPIEYDVVSKAGFLDRYKFILGRSQEVGNWFVKEWADFVFIDGGHEYDECYQDAVTWNKVLKKGGYMAFHDYESAFRALDGVKKAVDEVTEALGLEFIIRKGTMKVFRKVANENIPLSGETGISA